MINIDKIKTTISESLVPIGYKLVSVTYNHEGKDNYLHVIVDRKEAISMSDIENVTDVVSKKLDEIEDELPNSYMLDICSLGAEKDIEVSQIRDYIGEHISVHLIKPIKGDSYFVGDLVECNDETLTLFYFQKGVKKNTVIDRKNIDKAKIVVKI